MANTQHLQWLAEGADAWNARRQLSSFRPDFSGTDFGELLVVRKLGLENYDFSKANFLGANIADICFNGSDFTKATMYSVVAFAASFVGANLFASNWRKAQISYCNFSNCNLLDADFFESIRTGAIFEGSNRTDALGLNDAIDNHIAPSDTIDNDGAATDFEGFVPPKSPNRATPSPEALARLLAAASAAPIAVQAPIAGAPPAFGSITEKDNVYSVFFATNRSGEKTQDEKFSVKYSCQVASETTYGISSILVPEGHEIGSMGSSWLDKLFRRNGPLSIVFVSPLERDYYFASVSDLLNDRDVGATYFIHGFNTSFEDALLRAGQIGFDLGLLNGIGLFSWPSKGRFKDYVADERVMEESKYALASFIEDLAFSEVGGKINFIAHSMGCRCLALAMELLHLKSSPALEVIDKVILAAADIDQAIMKDLGLSITQHAKIATSYVCSADLALKVSGKLHAGARVGFAPPPYVMNNLDTIVVNRAKLESFGHAYVAENSDVISDMFNILKNGLRPERRFRLEQISGGTSSHWRIKK